MVKIIRRDFTADDFNKIACEFLYADIRIPLQGTSLLFLRKRLERMSSSFQKMIAAYFAKQTNARYDDLVDRMSAFAKKLMKYDSQLPEGESKVFRLFWYDIAESIMGDYQELNDNYLTYSCEYFIGEIEKLK